MVCRPYRRSGSGREAFPEVQERLEGPPEGLGVVVTLLVEVRQWSVGLPKGPGVVGRPSQRSGSGREALLEVRAWSGGPPRGSGGVSRRSWRSGSGRKALPKVSKWSGGPPGGPGVVGRPSKRSGIGQ